MEIYGEWSRNQIIEAIIQQVRELVDKKQRNFLVLRVSDIANSILANTLTNF
jgi:hypothetical protein